MKVVAQLCGMLGRGQGRNRHEHALVLRDALAAPDLAEDEVIGPRSHGRVERRELGPELLVLGPLRPRPSLRSLGCHDCISFDLGE